MPTDLNMKDPYAPFRLRASVTRPRMDVNNIWRAFTWFPSDELARELLRHGPASRLSIFPLEYTIDTGVPNLVTMIVHTIGVEIPNTVAVKSTALDELYPG